MATVLQDQVNTSGFGGGFGGFGMPFGVPVGGYGGFNGGGGFEGLIGLAIAASLFGRDGFGRGGHGCHDDNGEGTAALAAVIAALNNRNEPDKCEAMAAAVLAKLGTLEGQIPEANCELLLALQSAVAGLTAQGAANAAALTTQLNQLQLGQLVQSNAIQSSITTVNTNVAFQGSETRQAVAQSTAAILTALKDQEINTLRDSKIILANEVAELRSDMRHNEHRRELDGIRINIENNNNAIAAQAQFQQQRQTDIDNQRIRFDFERLHSRLDIIDSQFARATNNSVNVGNSGAIGTSQTANPTNVRA